MKKEMCCAIFTGQRAVELQRFPVSEVDDDKLLVKIETCGICTQEQRMFTRSINADHPLIGEHEVVGRIKAIRKDMYGDWKVGQRAIIGVMLPCRSYYFYKMHEEQSCQNFNTVQILSGQSYPGTEGFSEYMMAALYSMFPYTNATPQEVCVCEPVPRVIHSMETVNPQFDDACVIIGAGIMGLLHVQLCIEKGCFAIVADMDEGCLGMAASMGAHYIINLHKEYVEKKIMKITHGRKARVVFDITSAASVTERACRYVSNMEKLMIYNGIYPNKLVQMDVHWTHKGSIQILGTANLNDHDFIRTACTISEEIISIRPFISGVYPVEEISSTLASSCQGNTLRNITILNGEL